MQQTYYRSRKKDFLTGSLFLFILILLSPLRILAQAPANQQASLTTIVGVGDIMMGTSYPSTRYLPPNNGADLMTDVLDILTNADVTFGNFEGTFLNSGKTTKHCKNPNLCYAFRTPESYIANLITAGFDVMSIANNHSGDFGWAGRKKTKQILSDAGIHFAGLMGSDEYTIFKKNGLTYGFCAFAPNSGTVDIRNITKAKSIVAKLDKECDIVIVSFHGGAEGSKHQHVTRKTEKFYGENRGNVYRFAHAVIDAGADVVFGHGPHITRAIEVYKNRFIAYSLGNFCTYGRFSLNGPKGFAPIIKLKVNNDGSFVSGKIIPIYQQKTHGPKKDPQKRAIKKIIALTKADFPNSTLTIEEDGSFY